MIIKVADDFAFELVLRMSKLRHAVLPTLTIKVSHLAVAFTLDLAITAAPTLPFVQAVRLAFPESPEIDLRVSPLGGVDLSSIPGVRSWLQAELKGAMLDYVEPGHIIVNVTSLYGGTCDASPAAAAAAPAAESFTLVPAEEADAAAEGAEGSESGGRVSARAGETGAFSSEQAVARVVAELERLSSLPATQDPAQAPAAGGGRQTGLEGRVRELVRERVKQAANEAAAAATSVSGAAGAEADDGSGQESESGLGGSAAGSAAAAAAAGRSPNGKGGMARPWFQEAGDSPEKQALLAMAGVAKRWWVDNVEKKTRNTGPAVPVAGAP